MNWHEQRRASVTTLEELSRRGFVVPCFQRPPPLLITPHVLSLMETDTQTCPIGRQFVPHPDEQETVAAEQDDPIGEEKQTHAGVLVHAYPDRALLFVSASCATRCRFCTRKRWAGGAASPLGDEPLDRALDYLRRHPEIHDLLLSGGDPLLLEDDDLDRILSALRTVPTLKVIRIGSRTLSTLPQRITPELATLLQRHDVRYLNAHFNHPRELTAESGQAANRLRMAGVALGNQSVLLRGVNDRLETLRELCLGLYHMGIRPYYLYHCDLTRGDAYLRTTIAEGRRLVHGLQGWISGLAVPRYIFDGPGIRKTPLQPDYCTESAPGCYTFRNYRGERWTYEEKDALPSCRRHASTDE